MKRFLDTVAPLGLWALAAWVWFDLSRAEDWDDVGWIMILMHGGPFLLGGWLGLTIWQKAMRGWWLGAIPFLYLTYCLIVSWVFTVLQY